MALGDVVGYINTWFIDGGKKFEIRPVAIFLAKLVIKPVSLYALKICHFEDQPAFFIIL